MYNKLCAVADMATVEYRLFDDEEDDEPIDEALEDLLEAAAGAEEALVALSKALRQVEAAADVAGAAAGLQAAAEAADVAKRACRELELEVHGGASALPAGEEGAKLLDQQREASRRLQQMLGTLDFMRATREREALMLAAQKGGVVGGAGAAGTSSGGGENGGSVDADKLSPGALIAIGVQVQLESEAAVARMTRMVERTKEVGTSTLGVLSSQGERLRRCAPRFATRMCPDWPWPLPMRRLSPGSGRVLLDPCPLNEHPLIPPPSAPRVTRSS